MFEVGKLYNRASDIHAQFGGQRQVGICTPRSIPAIFIFTGEGGAAHGYRDEFREDGTFWYTGAGQQGDMAFASGNRAILEHQSAGKRIYLFENVGSGIRFIGEVSYLAHHIERRPDSRGETRTAIIFELELLLDRTSIGNAAEAPIARSSRFWTMSVTDLREAILHSTSPDADEGSRRAALRHRSKAVKVYVLRRASGQCEACGSPAPFRATDGRPFLETHHIHRLCDGGPDLPTHVAAVCPNCHREAHLGKSQDQLNRRLLDTVLALEDSVESGN